VAAAGRVRLLSPANGAREKISCTRSTRDTEESPLWLPQGVYVSSPRNRGDGEKLPYLRQSGERENRDAFGVRYSAIHYSVLATRNPA